MKSLEKTVRILDALVQTNGARIAELSERLDIPNSTVHSHLSALEDHGLVYSDGDVYIIGLKSLYYSGSLLYDDDIYSLIEPKVRVLARETGERAQFMSEQDGQAVYLFTEVANEGAVQTDVRPGEFVAPHATAAGKAILAHYSDGRVDEIVDRHGLESCTPHTITDRDTLFEELATVREQGYAVNDEERILKHRAIGVPVLDPLDRPIGGLSVGGPAHRISSGDHHDMMVNLLLGTAEEIELNIQY